MSVIYEVTLRIDRGVADEYDAWLGQHAAEMLELPGFFDAETFDVDDDTIAADRVARVVHYRVQSRAALEHYFREYAERMRGDGVERFGGRFTASRRILTPLA